MNQIKFTTWTRAGLRYSNSLVSLFCRQTHMRLHTCAQEKGGYVELKL